MRLISDEGPGRQIGPPMTDDMRCARCNGGLHTSFPRCCQRCGEVNPHFTGEQKSCTGESHISDVPRKKQLQKIQRHGPFYCCDCGSVMKYRYRGKDYCFSA